MHADPEVAGRRGGPGRCAFGPRQQGSWHSCTLGGSMPSVVGPCCWCRYESDKWGVKYILENWTREQGLGTLPIFALGVSAGASFCLKLPKITRINGVISGAPPTPPHPTPSGHAWVAVCLRRACVPASYALGGLLAERGGCSASVAASASGRQGLLMTLPASQTLRTALRHSCTAAHQALRPSFAAGLHRCRGPAALPAAHAGTGTLPPLQRCWASRRRALPRQTCWEPRTHQRCSSTCNATQVGRGPPHAMPRWNVCACRRKPE